LLFAAIWLGVFVNFIFLQCVSSFLFNITPQARLFGTYLPLGCQYQRHCILLTFESWNGMLCAICFHKLNGIARFLTTAAKIHVIKH